MNAFVIKLLSVFQKSSRRHPPARRATPVRLSVEALEGRELPSVSPLNLPVHNLSQGAHSSAFVVNTNLVTQRVLSNLTVATGGPNYYYALVPNLQGITFSLTTPGQPEHQLSITTEMWNSWKAPFNGSAAIAGTWLGDNGGKDQTMTGSLYYDAQGTLHISWSWGGNTGQATITYALRQDRYGVYGVWHLDGTINGGASTVSGDSQSLPSTTGNAP